MTTLCINIDNGPEWAMAKAEFDRVGLQVERFQAIVEDNRVLSFNKSVYECMKLAEGGDLLLFEDDCVFDLPATQLLLPMRPPDALTIHLGGNIIGSDNHDLKAIHGRPQRYNDYLVKVFAAWQTHAVLYSAECVKYIIDHFKFITDEYKTAGVEIFDDWLTRNVMSQGRSYMLNPMIAYQRPRKSEIWGVQVDNTGTHKQGNLWLKENI